MKTNTLCPFHAVPNNLGTCDVTAQTDFGAHLGSHNGLTFHCKSQHVKGYNQHLTCSLAVAINSPSPIGMFKNSWRTGVKLATAVCRPSFLPKFSNKSSETFWPRQRSTVKKIQLDFQWFMSRTVSHDPNVMEVRCVRCSMSVSEASERGISVGSAWLNFSVNHGRLDVICYLSEILFPMCWCSR